MVVYQPVASHKEGRFRAPPSLLLYAFLSFRGPAVAEPSYII